MLRHTSLLVVFLLTLLSPARAQDDGSREALQKKMDAISYALALMELGRADASTAVTLSVNSLVANCIAQWGNEAQKRSFLPRMTGGHGRVIR